jgi:hypothetical protein
MTKNTRTLSKVTVAIEPITPVAIVPEQLLAVLFRPLPVITY